MYNVMHTAKPATLSGDCVLICSSKSPEYGLQLAFQVCERIRYMDYSLSTDKTDLYWHVFLFGNLSICYFYDSCLSNKYAGYILKF
jgi:hypothetical protein